MSGDEIQAKKLDRDSFSTVKVALCEILENDLARHYKARASDKLAEADVEGASLILQTMVKMQQLADVLAKLPY